DGELEAIAERWAQIHGEERLVLNADDPLLADLGRERSDALYYGVEDDSLALPGMAHAADAKHCRRCGAPYVFDAIYLGHLGRYHCPRCGQRRPTPSVAATRISLAGVRSAQFTLRTADGEGEIALALPGLYNVYNALAAGARRASRYLRARLPAKRTPPAASCGFCSSRTRAAPTRCCAPWC